MTLYGPEAVARAIKGTLSTYFNTELDGVYTAWSSADSTDSITVPKVYPANIFEGRRELWDATPVIMVVPRMGKKDQDRSPDWQSMEHTVDVICVLNSDADILLDKMMMRYMWAVREVLGKHFDLPGGSLNGMPGAWLSDYQLSGAYSKPGGFQAEGKWTVSVWLDENL